MNRFRLWLVRRFLPQGWYVGPYTPRETARVVYATYDDGLYAYDGTGYKKVG